MGVQTYSNQPAATLVVSPSSVYAIESIPPISCSSKWLRLRKPTVSHQETHGFREPLNAFDQRSDIICSIKCYAAVPLRTYGRGDLGSKSCSRLEGRCSGSGESSDCNRHLNQGGHARVTFCVFISYGYSEILFSVLKALLQSLELTLRRSISRISCTF